MSPEAASSLAQASFRDPAGRLVADRKRILRLINESGVAMVGGLLASARVQDQFARGRLVRTQVLSPGEGRETLTALGFGTADSRAFPMVLEHERVPFPSFPYEWPPELLWDAGRLTLDLAEDLLSDNWGLKDATPYNVLFRGCQPIFVDLLSFERREPRDPTWLPYAQFVRTFLLPLLASRKFGLSAERIFLTNRDGLEPEELYRLCGPLQRLLPPFLTLVTLPSWLGGKQQAERPGLYEPKLMNDAERAAFVLRGLLKHLRRSLRRLAPSAARSSTWSGYMTSLDHYTDAQFRAKQAFVEQALRECGSTVVLDVGCNTGVFSTLAAEQGARVVAIDYDPVVVGRLVRTVQERKLDILPLVVNLTRPTPAVGWRNRECPSFLDRARGGFDMVLLLAVVHHMLVTERIPLEEIVDVVADLTTDAVVVEYVAPVDPLFRRLTRGREALHADLTAEVFESAWRRYFRVVRVDSMGTDTRALYLLRRNRGG